ncbi:hypothetical protein AB0383_05735 [Amycolatopsis sp. NPDC051373]|uniref:hypothetical protein n=1 Tax=Amycolatopsis sp. NPDC051373 TaxID=3155801 RepID=UPI00344D6A31
MSLADHVRGARAQADEDPEAVDRLAARGDQQRGDQGAEDPGAQDRVQEQQDDACGQEREPRGRAQPDVVEVVVSAVVSVGSDGDSVVSAGLLEAPSGVVRSMVFGSSSSPSQSLRSHSR